MQSTYEEHCAKVEAIRDYIKALSEIANIPSQYPHEHSAIALKEFVRVPQKRIYDYSLIIITLYGIFESYVEKILCAYLNSLRVRVHSYAALPEPLQKNHIDLSAKLLGTNSTKFGEISPSDIIGNLNSCLNQSGNSYQINIEAFRQHSANFRQETLREFFNQAGVKNIQNYITKDSCLTSFLRISMGEEESDEILPISKYFEMLEDLVERRNTVAHGSEVDNLLSFDYLDQYAQYISLLLHPIYEALLFNFYSILIDTNSISALGPPISVYNNSIVCLNSANFAVKVGDVLISKNGEGDLGWGTILSIKINDAFVNEVSPTQAIDIGIAVDFTAKKNFTYFLYADENS